VPTLFWKSRVWGGGKNATGELRISRLFVELERLCVCVCVCVCGIATSP